MQRFFILRQNEVMRVILAILATILCFGTVENAVAQRKIEPTTEFTVSGMVEERQKIDIKSILSYPQISLGDVVVKNHKGEEKKVAKNVKGVLLKTVLEQAKIKVNKPKEYSELVVVLTATDGYRNVYSWNELMNNPAGEHVYIITEQDGKDMTQMENAIIIVSTSDINAGSRYFKGLKSIDIRRVD